jgi:hypothetical protein
MTYTRMAGELSATHIGDTITFDWAFPSETRAKVTGQLRQISHTSGDTIVQMSAPAPTDTGVMDEFVLPHTQRVTGVMDEFILQHTQRVTVVED